MAGIWSWLNIIVHVISVLPPFPTKTFLLYDIEHDHHGNDEHNNNDRDYVFQDSCRIQHQHIKAILFR